IVPVPLENAVELGTTASNGTSEYGTSTLVRATIGDLAEPYAAFLNKNGYQLGHEWFLTPKNLHDLGVDDKNVEVRRVGVGGFGYIYINVLGAYGQCNVIGRARGVRKTSTGNKGDC